MGQKFPITFQNLSHPQCHFRILKHKLSTYQATQLITQLLPPIFRCKFCRWSWFNCPLPLEIRGRGLSREYTVAPSSSLTFSSSVAILGQPVAPGLGPDLNQLVSSQLTQRWVGRSTHIARAPPDWPRQISLSPTHYHPFVVNISLVAFRY